MIRDHVDSFGSWLIWKMELFGITLKETILFNAGLDLGLVGSLLCVSIVLLAKYGEHFNDVLTNLLFWTSWACFFSFSYTLYGAIIVFGGTDDLLLPQGLISYRPVLTLIKTCTIVCAFMAVRPIIVNALNRTVIVAMILISLTVATIFGVAA